MDSRFPFYCFDKIELKSIKKRESGKRGRISKDEILKTYYKIGRQFVFDWSYII